VIRFGYWLLAFVITAYFVNTRGVFLKTARILGWSIFALGLLRWGEVVLYGNVGAWTGTHLMSQNSYGFQFSTYSPFLLILMIQQRGWKRLFMVVPNVIVWGAIAINGSRGSWVAIGVGVGAFLILLLWSRPRKLIEMMALMILLISAIGGIYLTFPERFGTVVSRFDTFSTLEDDKSYMVRQVMNQKSIKLFKDSPLIGVGAARYRLSTVSLEIPSLLRSGSQESFDSKSSHNSYLSFLAENGLFGAVPFGILVLVLLFQGLRWVTKFTRRGEYWALAIFLAFIEMSVHMWVISLLTNTSNWFVYGLLAAMIIMGPKYFDTKRNK
jgi:O-antigen ligase